MEKKEINTQLYGARWAILFAGIVSLCLMTISEYGDAAFRWSLIFLMFGIIFFMFVVTSFIAYFLSDNYSVILKKEE